MTAEFIIETVAKDYGLTVPELMSINRHRDIIRARHEAIYFCRKLTKMSLRAIADCFPCYKGTPDYGLHCIVLHACKSIQGRIDIYGDYRDEMRGLEEYIKKQYDGSEEVRQENEFFYFHEYAR